MPKSSASRKKSSGGGGSGVVTLDLSKTEGRKAARHYDEGDYLVKVKEAKYGKSAQKETPQIVFELIFQDGKYKGKSIFHRCNLLENSLWVLRNMLEAMGVKVPDKKFKLDLVRLKGKELAITVEDDEYEGKIVSRITDTFPASEFEANVMDDEDEEEESDDEEAEDSDDEDEDEEEEESDDEDEEESEELDEIDLDEDL